MMVNAQWPSFSSEMFIVGIRSCVSEVILALSSWTSRLSPLNIDKYGFKPGKKKEIWKRLRAFYKCFLKYRTIQSYKFDRAGGSYNFL